MKYIKSLHFVFIIDKYFFHNPQLLLTMYELCFISEEEGPSHYFLFAAEINNILLVSYSSFNPLAYCGGLILKVLAKGYFKCVRQLNDAAPDLNDASQALSQIERKRTLKYNVKWTRRMNSKDLSEYDAMKSVGITLNGPEAIEVQLNELDPQSRIMCGLSKNGSSDESNSSILFFPKNFWK